MTVNCPSCNEPVKVPSRNPAPAPPRVRVAPVVKAPVKRTNPAVQFLIGILILMAIIVLGSVLNNLSSSSHHNVQTPSAQDAPFEIERKEAEGFQFEVELKERGKFLACNVSFNGTLPPPETVDKILHDSLQSAAQSHPTREIQAMAWHGDDALETNQFSGHLIYKPAERRIMRLDESRE